MKTVLAQFLFESNTFAPGTTGLEIIKSDVTWLDRVDDIRQWCAAGLSQMAGGLRLLVASGVEVVPVFVAACGSPAGRLDRKAWRDFRAAFLAAVQRELPADALHLYMHSAGRCPPGCTICGWLAGPGGAAGRVTPALPWQLDVAGRSSSNPW